MFGLAVAQNLPNLIHAAERKLRTAVDAIPYLICVWLFVHAYGVGGRIPPSHQEYHLHVKKWLESGLRFATSHEIAVMTVGEFIYLMHLCIRHPDPGDVALMVLFAIIIALQTLLLWIAARSADDAVLTVLRLLILRVCLPVQLPRLGVTLDPDTPPPKISSY